jgi:hypothetical protein
MPDAAAIGRTPEAVRRFVEGLLNVDTSEDAEDPDPPEILGREDGDHGQMYWQAIDSGLRFGTGLLATDPSDEAFELLLRAAERSGGDEEPDSAVIERALRLLARAMDPKHPEVVAAAKSDAEAVRRALAGALDPARPEARALLVHLAGDVHTTVRNAAREQLSAGGHEVPWWAGLFADDPFASIAPEEAASVAGPLGQLSELLRNPPYVKGGERVRMILDVLRALPDRLVVALVPRILPAETWAAREFVPELLAREGGAAALAKLVDDDEVGMRLVLSVEDLTKTVAALPPARRAEIRATLGVLPKAGEHDPGVDALFTLAMSCAAPDEDLWPLAEPLVDRGDSHALSRVLRAPIVPGTRLAEEIGQAASEGFPGKWSNVRWAVEKWVARAPAAWLRPLAERAIRSESESARRWGLAMLTGEAFDPAQDGDRAERAAALALDPRFAADFLADRPLTLRALPMLRGRIVRGEAPLAETLATLGAVTRANSYERAAVEALFGPGWVTPVTPEEWVVLRRLRTEAIRENPDDAREHLYHLEVREPDHPEDHALLAQVVADATTPDKAGNVIGLILRSGPNDGSDNRHPADIEFANVLRERFPDVRWVQAGWRLITRQL